MLPDTVTVMHSVELKPRAADTQILTAEHVDIASLLLPTPMGDRLFSAVGDGNITGSHLINVGNRTFNYNTVIHPPERKLPPRFTQRSCAHHS